jgi:hypothetical protein
MRQVKSESCKSCHQMLNINNPNPEIFLVNQILKIL